MIAKHEVREYTHSAEVFLAKYLNLNNILHWHYDCELVRVESGSLQIYVSGKTHTLKEGQMMYIGNMEEHSIRTTEQSKAQMIIFRFEIIKPLVKNLKLSSPILSGDYSFTDLYDKVKAELLSANKFSKEFIENKVSAFVLEIFRLEQTEKAEVKKKDKMAFMRLLDDIDRNFRYYTSDDGAKFLSVTKVYFSKYFKKMSGVVFNEYLNKVRIGKAVDILKNNKEALMSDVADYCGYNTIRNFNRTFKLLTGYIPTDLPQDFVFSDNSLFFSSSQNEFNPTLNETVVIEAFNGNVKK